MGNDSEEDLTWKWRIFWTEYDHNRNKMANFGFLGMEPEKLKEEHHSDTYFYLPNTMMNIKRRDDNLIFMEIREKKGDYCGFAGKRQFRLPVEAVALPVDLHCNGAIFTSWEELMEAFSRFHPGFKVYRMDKKRFSAAFSSKDKEKKLKAEFAEIRFGNKIFQTFCLESKQRKWLKENIERLKINDGIVTDYYRLLALL